MCYGLIISSMIALIINTYYTGKLIHVGFLIQMRDLTPTILYSLVMGATVMTVAWLIPGNLLKLIAGTTTGIAVYALLAYMTRSQDLRELRNLVKK